MKLLKFASLVTLAALFLTSAVFARERIINETFPAVPLIEINTVSGHCIVIAGKGDKIDLELTASYMPEDNFEPVIKKREKKLVLKEMMLGSTRGESVWKLIVPENTEIRFSSASGDLEVEGLKGSVYGNTASGLITVDKCAGEMQLNSASGNVELADFRGFVSANSASGDVVGTNIILDDESSFSSASGDTHVELGETPQVNLSVSSASGDAILVYNGHPFKGRFIMVAQRSGRIRAPFQFDEEETIERYGQDYIRKIAVKEIRTPRIRVETGSGRAILED